MFQKIMTRAINVDREKYGVWPEYDARRELLIDKVIPRLLDPLVSDGRTIKPCLVHGDLWDENSADGKSPNRLTSERRDLFNRTRCEYWGAFRVRRRLNVRTQ